MSNDDKQLKRGANLERRSFLKLVGSGLLASIPVAMGLLKPTPVKAALCDDLYCTWQGSYVCSNGTLFLKQDNYCWDRYNMGFLCYQWTTYTAIGCC